MNQTKDINLNTKEIIQTNNKKEISKNQSIINNNNKSNDSLILQKKSKESSESLLNKKFIDNIEINITVELGQKKITIKELLSLSQNSILVLDKLAGELLNIFANGLLIAYGEIVMLHNKYGIRITNIINNYSYNNLNNNV
ncbi:flagellar motor switch protein [Buchnera aphidicola (Nipponaphis monzeni)]|uniref:Flagellar motor switch protein FliN n=1 Tax=Buchnera aphidicola (Nipponaphis monzeni) TaxID=2495405 RepID=A0A455T9S6_9GAMM|nr:flagellar motor switch protein FliN [Buchnera aphidicola]BBI01081.1 flagellar motor switch protein [Buchnera aphidicola (Nipponaphis monzeni)]